MYRREIRVYIVQVRNDEKYPLSFKLLSLKLLGNYNNINLWRTVLRKRRILEERLLKKMKRNEKRINSEKTYREFVNQSFLFRNNIISKINMNLLNLTKYIYSFLSCNFQFICPIIKTHSRRLLLTSTLLNTL